MIKLTVTKSINDHVNPMQAAIAELDKQVSEQQQKGLTYQKGYTMRWDGAKGTATVKVAMIESNKLVLPSF